jgi:hypothetical protein
MEEENLIPADEFCTNYEIEVSFIHSLQECGLIELTTIEQRGFIPSNKVAEIEKYLHLHYDLDINMSGIEAIAHMLERVKNLQQEVSSLKNKLRLYENNF